jgi:hypothetical protein
MALELGEEVFSQLKAAGLLFRSLVCPAMELLCCWEPEVEEASFSWLAEE